MLGEIFIQAKLLEILKLELEYLDFMVAEPESPYIEMWEAILKDCRSKAHALKWVLQEVRKI